MERHGSQLSVIQLFDLPSLSPRRTWQRTLGVIFSNSLTCPYVHARHAQKFSRCHVVVEVSACLHALRNGRSMFFLPNVCSLRLSYKVCAGLGLRTKQI